MSMDITTSGARPLPPFSWQAAATMWAATVSPTVVAALRKEAPVDTGRLRDSIRAMRAVTASTVTIRFVAVPPYTRFVLDGTRPHQIRARNARALAFHWRGELVFRQSVNHPGTRPNRFPARAMAAVRPAVQAEFTRVMSRAMSGR